MEALEKRTLAFVLRLCAPTEVIMARAMWKGVVKVGTAKLPVKLYAAVSDQNVHFRLLHKKDKQPVTQEMINPESGEVVPDEEIGKAYFDESGVIVRLEEDELDALQ